MFTYYNHCSFGNQFRRISFVALSKCNTNKYSIQLDYLSCVNSIIVQIKVVFTRSTQINIHIWLLKYNTQYIGIQ